MRFPKELEYGANVILNPAHGRTSNNLNALPRQLQKKPAENGRGCWKNIAAAPLRVGCMHFHMESGLHPK